LSLKLAFIVEDILSVTHYLQDNTSGVAMGNMLNDWVSIPGRGKSFSVLHNVQTGSGANPVSYPISTDSYFTRGNADGP
jgi:hypothetical protein